MALAAVLLTGCFGRGSARSTPGAALAAFVAAWNQQAWSSMATQVTEAPADFVAVNAAVVIGMDATGVAVTAGPVSVPTPGHATAPITSRYAVPGLGTAIIDSRVALLKIGPLWKVQWTPATIDPVLGSGDRFVRVATPATRAAITGAGGAALVSAGRQVEVGIEGSRVRNRAAVSKLLVKGGATAAEVAAALTTATAHPAWFVPVYTITQADFEDHVRGSALYNVRGTEFESDPNPTAVTPGLTAYVVGSVGPITAQQLQELGPPYVATDTVGQNGLEAQYEKRLAGRAGLDIAIVDAHGHRLTTVATAPPTPGDPVVTTISVPVQKAAEAAIAGTATPAALVAVQASTGAVLAVANNDPTDSGIDYALDSLEAPGSTFKTVTSTALIADRGLTPASPATCPATRTVDGEIFHNDEGEASGAIDLLTAFAQSCNTAFIGLATTDLTSAQLVAAATSYNIGTTPQMGFPAYGGSVPVPPDLAGLASAAIGQGATTVSPLVMAMVAAAIDSGTVRLPRLVVGAADDRAPTHPLDPTVRTDLRTMMAAVVASGTAAGAGLPAGTFAKTGTAEFGSAVPPQTHAWLIGFDQDVAFAVFVDIGVSGGKVAAPLAARFLKALTRAALAFPAPASSSAPSASVPSRPTSPTSSSPSTT
jgi:cell division protein FtsI/penicillin-binding protein 2